jgi:hypothetical protein
MDPIGLSIKSKAQVSEAEEEQVFLQDSNIHSCLK